MRDADGTFVWSTSTGGRSVLGLKLTGLGNLVLFGRKNKVVWQSFDHPTDSLVLGQELLNGQRLTSGSLDSNSSQGKHFLAVENGILVGYIDSNPSQVYSYTYLNQIFRFKNASFAGLFWLYVDPQNLSARFENGNFAGFEYYPTKAAQFLSLE